MTAKQLLKLQSNDSELMTNEDLRSALGTASIRETDTQVILNLSVDDKEIVIYTGLTADRLKSKIAEGEVFRIWRRDDIPAKRVGTKMYPLRHAYEFKDTVSDLLDA